MPWSKETVCPNSTRAKRTAVFRSTTSPVIGDFVSFYSIFPKILDFSLHFSHSRQEMISVLFHRCHPGAADLKTEIERWRFWSVGAFFEENTLYSLSICIERQDHMQDLDIAWNSWSPCALVIFQEFGSTKSRENERISNLLEEVMYDINLPNGTFDCAMLCHTYTLPYS